ncbi:hypothetical protein GGS24DRAFT_212167 [Hypoxylon argillaceum]|nr:hypothetical protein GGS24DRAFT_212167 [Hypoxylon argillaceum]
MQSPITRTGPASVTFDLAHPEHTVITLPPGSTWSSGLHFHSLHDEYLVVQRGSVRVRRDSDVQTVTVRPGDAPIELAIPRGVWHEWGRALPDLIDPDYILTNEDVLVVERTNPADGEKTVFFWNLNGVILQKPPQWLPTRRLWGLWVTLQLFVIFAELDNVPVMIDVRGLVARARLDGVMRHLMGQACVERCSRSIDESWSLFVLWVVHRVGRMLGIEAVRRDYTPEEAYRLWIPRWQKKTL